MKFAQLPSLLSFTKGSTLGDKYDLILPLGSQIFDFLRNPFCRRALGNLQSAR